MNRRQLLPLLILLATFLNVGCHPAPVQVSFEKDQFGCPIPPPDVFTQAGVDFSFAKSTYKDLVFGGVDIKTNPQVVTLASKAVTDSRIRDFMRCQTIHRDKFSPEQAAHMDMFNGFLSCNPTPDHVIQWQKNYQFPKGNSEPEVIFEKIKMGVPEKDMYLSEIMMKIDSIFPVANLYIAAKSPSIIMMTVTPQRTGADFRGLSRTGESGEPLNGIAFTNIPSAFGKYLIKVTTKALDNIDLEYNFN